MCDAANRDDDNMDDEADNAATCTDCGATLDDDNPACTADHPDADGLCQDCFWSNHSQCAACDGTIHDEDTHESLGGRHRGESLCESCFDASHSTCTECGDAVHDDRAIRGPDDNPYCADCWSDTFFTCDDCGEDFHRDDYGGDGRCQSCCDADGPILGYYEDADAILGFLGTPADRLFYGVELEIECKAGDPADRAETCLGLLGSDFAIAKHDDSLNRGFELVTAPATLDIHRERWPQLLDDVPQGLASWDTQTCGMHIHVSRDAISPYTLGKILVFVNRPENRDFLRKIAGRESSRWASFDGYKRIVDAKSRCGDRYQAINLTNSATIEFRIFRGTLNRDSFIKNIEFVAAVIRFARYWGPGQMTVDAFLADVASAPKLYPSLSRWLRAKGMLAATRPAPELVEV